MEILGIWISLERKRDRAMMVDGRCSTGAKFVPLKESEIEREIRREDERESKRERRTLPERSRISSRGEGAES